MVLATLFLAAILTRAAAYVRLDYAPWWDGVGWGYPDGVWISRAIRLAGGDFTALDYRSEGLMFIPAHAILIRIFGTEAGFHVWAWFLVITNALIVPIAAHTVFLTTGRIVAALFMGTLVIADPISMWFGLNGWSDGQTAVSVAFTCWAFMLCARLPSMPRQILLSLSLSVLALGHATWTYPSLIWGVLAWPLLSTRKRWFPRAISTGSKARSFGWMRTLPVPILTVSIIAATVITVSSFESLNQNDNQAVSWNWAGLGALSGDANNQRALVVTYDDTMTWYDVELPDDSVRIVLTKFLPRATGMMPGLVIGHIANVIPLYRWLLLVIGLAVLVIILSRWRSPWPSHTGLIAIPVTAAFFVNQQAMNEAASMLSYLIFMLAFMYIPVARVLTLLFLPFMGLMLLYLPLLTQTRHTNALVFFVFLVAAISVGYALNTGNQWYRRWPKIRWGTIRIGAISLSLAVLVAVGTIHVAAAIESRRSEARYLEWLTSLIDDKDYLFTSGDVDPWEVRKITGTTVIYDVENGGRVVLMDGQSDWGLTSLMHFQRKDNGTYTGDMLYATADEAFEKFRAQGRQIWFYTPWTGKDPVSIVPNFIPDPERFKFHLVPIATYPEHEERSALIFGSPILEDPD